MPVKTDLELGLTIEHAGAVEFLRDQHRQPVAELVGTQVVLDVSTPPWRRAQNRGVHRTCSSAWVRCGQVRRITRTPAALHTPVFAGASGSRTAGPTLCLGSSSRLSCQCPAIDAMFGRCVHDGMRRTRPC